VFTVVEWARWAATGGGAAMRVRILGAGGALALLTLAACAVPVGPGGTPTTTVAPTTTTTTAPASTTTIASTTTTTMGLPPGLLAIAYSNLDGIDGYDAGGSDVLISRLDDTNGDGVPSIGDTVTLGRYPLNFDATAFGTFRDPVHPVTAVDLTDADGDGRVTEIGAWISADSPIYWASRRWFEGTAGFNSNGAWHANDNLSGTEEADAKAGSPGDPDTATSRQLRLSSTDDPFVDVDVTFLPHP
jgi:hypothetical protein